MRNEREERWVFCLFFRVFLRFIKIQVVNFIQVYGGFLFVGFFYFFLQGTDRDQDFVICGGER